MINSFTGDYYFLSNFYNVGLIYEGILYHNSEAAFQAAKTVDEDLKVKISTMDPSSAKRAGRRLELRGDWELIKDNIMYEICLTKFIMNESLKERLLATGDEELVEGNTWHDNYWGNCTCTKCKDIPGRNQLGKTLMRIREELRGEL